MIDLILCTKDRPKDFAHFLKELHKSTNKNFYLIVVDQSNDAVSKLNKDQLRLYNFDYRYCRDPFIGLSRARNIGIKFCKNKIVCFPDDDCYYPITLIAYVLKQFENSSIQFLTGSYAPEGSDCFKRDSARRLNIRNVGKYLSSVTFFARREYLSDFKFDERIGAGTRLSFGEEIDFVFRNLNNKKISLFDPNIHVFHPNTIRNIGAVQANHIYGTILGLNYKNNAIKTYFLLGLFKLLFIFITGRATFACITSRIHGFAQGVEMKREGYSP